MQLRPLSIPGTNGKVERVYLSLRHDHSDGQGPDLRGLDLCLIPGSIVMLERDELAAALIALECDTSSWPRSLFSPRGDASRAPSPVRII